MTKRALIVTADDFGQSPGINRGVIEAHRHGIVTSASLMVRWPAAGDAATLARTTLALSVGLHVDLGEFVFVDGSWQPRYQVVDLDDYEDVADEVDRQLDAFDDLVGHPPTHLDSHQHVHRNEPVRSILLRAGRELGIPVREVTSGITYSGAFYGQTAKGAALPEALTVESLGAVIRDLPPGVTELGCHPGEDDVESTYGAERAVEVATLCDPRIRTMLAELGVWLCSFAELSAMIRRLAAKQGLGGAQKDKAEQ